METQSPASDLEIDFCDSVSSFSKPAKHSGTHSEDLTRAKDLLRVRYQDYLLKTSVQFVPAACCTALVPYVENTHLKALKEVQSFPDVEMMDVEVEMPSLKRKRCDDYYIPFVPKLAKLCCL
jgi:hypothetical protein